MEELKKFEEVSLPDIRNTFWVTTNRKTGETRTLDLKDIYEGVKVVELHEGVPADVRSQFNIARNLAIYTWFSYPFHQISELKAFSTVEYALRKYYGADKDYKYSFEKLIQKAVSDGLIKDSGFSHIEDSVISSDPQNYSKKLPGLMPKFRNNLAHGSNTLDWGAVRNLQICADFINQLFQKTESQTANHELST